MKIKKILGLSILALATYSISACTAPNGTVTNVTIWHYYNNQQETAFQSIVELFNESVGKEKNIKVSEESLGYVSDLSSAIVDSANGLVGSKAMPDMFMSYSDTAYLLDTMGKITSLEPYFTDEELSEYNQQFIDEGRIGKDKVFKIMPIAKSTEALYINTTDFNKFISDSRYSNYSYDDLVYIEDIIELAKDYYVYSGGKAFYGRDSLSNYFICGAKQLGVELFDYDSNNNFFVNTRKDIYRKLYDNYYIPLISGYFVSNGKFRSSDMQDGKLICYTGSTSSSNYFPKGVTESDDVTYNIEGKVILAPVFKNSVNNTTVSQGAGVAVTKSTEEKQSACVEFLKWLTDSDEAVKFSTDSSYLPVKNNRLNNSLLEIVDTTIEKEAYQVGLTGISNNTLFVNQACIYGESIRSVFDTSLNSLAKKTQALILEDEKTMSHEAAVAKYSTDEAFEEWYSSIISTIEEKYKIS